MFLLHCILSAAACLVAWIAVIAIGPLLVTPSGANSALIVGLAMAITNCIAASLACRKISTVGARWVWVPLALLIPYTYTNYPPAQTMGQHLSHLWNQFFGGNCGATECLGQLFLGMPFVGTVMYAATAVFVRWDTSPAAASKG